MPFEKNFPRSLSASSIRQFAPAVSGVYGLSNARGWLYIGESDDIQGALLGHLETSPSAYRDNPPTGFVFEICTHGARIARQSRLVQEYSPTGNRR